MVDYRFVYFCKRTYSYTLRANEKQSSQESGYTARVCHFTTLKQNYDHSYTSNFIIYICMIYNVGS